MTFEELNMAAPLLQAIKACGYDEPTPIQAKRHSRASRRQGPHRLRADRNGEDRCIRTAGPASAGDERATFDDRSARRGRATRTGARHRRANWRSRLRTRSCAMARFCASGRCAFTVARPYPVQNRQLERGVDVLVGTPGRLIDHLERGRIDLSNIRNADHR
jgi:hypothetical protein